MVFGVGGIRAGGSRARELCGGGFRIRELKLGPSSTFVCEAVGDTTGLAGDGVSGGGYILLSSRKAVIVGVRRL